VLHTLLKETAVFSGLCPAVSNHKLNFGGRCLSSRRKWYWKNWSLEGKAGQIQISCKVENC